jgi:2-polyprenyl-3-methyl-5-hydroxy-6-metoxy-1,4-benzoquinol methylase
MSERGGTARGVNQLKAVDYFDVEAAGWTARYTHNRHFQARLDTVLHWLADAPKGLELLDYGCGSGVLLQSLARSGHRVTGADISEGMLEEARKNVPTVSYGETVRLVRVNDRCEGGYADRLYDGIVSLGVFEYLDGLDEPRTLIKLLSQQLKPGGFLIVSVPNRRSWLRQAERWVHSHPYCFRALNLFSHLTGPDSYLHFQKHQWTIHEFGQLLGAKDYRLRRVRYHVAPKLLAAVEHQARIGMTAVVKFVKAG